MNLVFWVLFALETTYEKKLPWALSNLLPPNSSVCYQRVHT